MGARSRTRIAHLTSVHPPDDVRIFHKECGTLAAAGYEVTVIAPHDQEEIWDGVRIRIVPKPTGRWERITRTVWQVYSAAAAEDACVYHLHDPELLPMGMLLRARGKHVVYDVHEDVPKQLLSKSWVPSHLRRLGSRGMAALEAVAGRMFSGIVAATPPIAARFPSSRTVVVHNFPKIKSLAASQELRYSERSARVIYVGVISESRGAREMMDAMSLLPASLDCQLVLAGTVRSSILRRELVASDGEGSVEFLGRLPHSEIPQLLQRAVIGLVVLHPVPYYVESYPIKMFEYMAAGIPVIASDFPLWRNIIQDADCGLLVDSLDPQAIADGIRWLLEHPEEAEAMGVRGQQAVLERYNWHIESRKLVSFYGRLLEKA